jgi:DNA polymerase IIIc chi subunit
MSEIRFYHLQRASLEDNMPVILERAYVRCDRTLVIAS